MKQEILCLGCGKKRMKGHGLVYSKEFGRLVDPFPGEHVKYEEGKAKAPFLCDFCGCEIMPTGRCFAVSTWADYGGIPYYEWELEFIEPIVNSEHYNALFNKEASDGT